MHWAQFESEQPKLAALGRQKPTDPGVVLVGTIRADGSPRISGVEPLIWRRDLWLCVGLGSRKAVDLRRDPRVLVHSIVTSRGKTAAELKLLRASRSGDPCLDPGGVRWRSGAAHRLEAGGELGRRHLHPLGRRHE